MMALAIRSTPAGGVFTALFARAVLLRKGRSEGWGVGGSVYVLSTLLFLYCALRANVRCNYFINTLLHYITRHYYTATNSVLCTQGRGVSSVHKY